MGVDVVGEAEDRFLVGGVPLHRHLDLAVVGLAFEEDRLAVQRVLVLVEVGDEVDDAALVVEGVLLAAGALVDQLDLEAAGEEGGLAQALGQGRVVELELVEDLVVGEEGDRRAVRVGGLAAMEIRLRLAALVVLGPDRAVAADFEVEPLGEGVDDRDADAVQAAGDLVAAASPNLPPACSVVSTTSAAGRFSFFISSTGMPRPSSATVQLLSGCRTTRTSSQ